MREIATRRPRPAKDLDLPAELRPSMIAVAAASHALDALYGEVRDVALPEELARKWRDNPRSGPPRPRKLFETLKRGFGIPDDPWLAEIEALFDIRDAAIHPETAFHVPRPHPLGVGAAQEYVVYSAEVATNAVALPRA